MSTAPAREQQVSHVPLTIAALRLRVSREIALRRVLTGELEGEKDEDGRWQVSSASLERALAAGVGPTRSDR